MDEYHRIPLGNDHTVTMGFSRRPSYLHKYSMDAIRTTKCRSSSVEMKAATHIDEVYELVLMSHSKQTRECEGACDRLSPKKSLNLKYIN